MTPTVQFCLFYKLPWNASEAGHMVVNSSKYKSRIKFGNKLSSAVRLHQGMLTITESFYLILCVE